MATMQASTSRAAFQPAARRGFVPFKASRLATVTVRAEAASSSSPSSSGAKPISMSWPKDTETIKDVFAITGSLPERVNGRVAMWGWANLLGPELAKHTPVGDQFGDAWWGIIPFTILITFASILPKLVSGVPLRELHAAATSDNLKGEGIVGQIAPVFNNNIELWAGRAAMMGLTTLVLIEAVKGEAFF